MMGVKLKSLTNFVSPHQLTHEQLAGFPPLPLNLGGEPPGTGPGMTSTNNSKRCSRASDTSSAYSGSDLMHNSLDEGEGMMMHCVDTGLGDMDLSGLAESIVDSDDEEGYAESTEVCGFPPLKLF